MKTEMKAAMILAIATILAAAIGLFNNTPQQITDNSIINSVKNIDLSKHSAIANIFNNYNVNNNNNLDSTTDIDNKQTASINTYESELYENKDENGDSKTIYLLAQNLNNGDYSARLEAYRAIMKFGSAAVDPLIQVLETGTDDGKEYAALALGEIGDARAIKPLAQALNNGDYSARLEAYRAIMKFGSAVVDPLIQVLETGTDDGKEYAALALGEIGDARAIKPLAQALNNGDYSARLEAYRAIEKFGSAAIDPLNQVLETGTNDGKEYAALALGNLRG